MYVRLMIGKGGTSEVYHVLDDKLTLCALKRVKLDKTSESAIVKEIHLMQALNKADVAHVVRLFDFQLRVRCSECRSNSVGRLAKLCSAMPRTPTITTCR